MSSSARWLQHTFPARELFAAVVDVLPREKAIHLMLEWKTSSRNYESELDLAVAEPQLHAAMRFILEQTGIFIEKHEKLPWKKVRFQFSSVKNSGFVSVSVALQFVFLFV